MLTVLRAMTLGGVLTLACLPADPPGFHRDAGRSVVRAPAARAATTVKRKPAPEPKPTSAPDAEARLISEALNEDFNRADLGPDWNLTSPAWKLEDGRLCAKGAKNHPAWFVPRLPRNARIEFDVTGGSPDGDLKAEAWGDGHSVPAGATYNDATSYIVILGGWKNHFHVLARLNEHAPNRVEQRLVPGSEDPRQSPIAEGRTYHVEIERGDGHTVRVTVDDTLLHELDDPAPLVGHDHEHFAFNDWDVPVCFDDLLVTPYPD
ncbi:MAG TPA: hypothetical protein VGQ57_15840 [Polyangiaceae bacterium]|nr:hypothetical protein [Polyangiaceae bacterium]